MCKQVVISVPLKRHVKEFLLREFGPVEPLRIDQRQFIGQTVKLVLTKNPYRINTRKRIQCEESRPDILKIVLPTSLKHHVIEDARILDLSKFFEKFFVQQMVQFIKGAVHYTQNETDAVKVFCRAYNINPDHYDDETARKAWRDYKNNLFEANSQYMELTGAVV